MLDIEAAYQKYSPLVYRRCLFLLGSDDKALDAMHDIFAALMQKSPSYTSDNLVALLFRMATNTCLNIIRAEKKIYPGAPELLREIATGEDIENETIIRSFLNSIFAKEHETSRLIAVLHYIDGMTLEEVAREVKMSVSGVRKRLTKLKAYRELWEKDYAT